MFWIWEKGLIAFDALRVNSETCSRPYPASSAQIAASAEKFGEGLENAYDCESYSGLRPEARISCAPVDPSGSWSWFWEP
jgi:hypothetical protein